jgi:AmiR/NasT family two-component response regulator
VHATVAIATVQQASTLAEAVEARGLMGQAQGLLMERFALDAEQAFAVLRRYSQNNNIKLHVVAAQLITTRQLPQPSRLGRAERSGAKGTG